MTDSANRLFSLQLSTVIVCAYDRAGRPAMVQYEGRKAKQLARSIQRAPFHWSSSCPVSTRSNTGLIPANATRYTIIGTTSDGKPAGTVDVAVAPGCSVVLRNGNVVRFHWTIPSDLLQLLDSAKVGATPVPSPSPS